MVISAKVVIIYFRLHHTDHSGGSTGSSPGGIFMKKVKNAQQKSKKTQKKPNILLLTQTAILTAIVFILGFTPIGFLKIGAIEITFLVIPVAIGAIVLGPYIGAFLGLMFGTVSFIQCFTGSIFGATLLSISPLFTFILCIIPRVLMGFLCGIIFKVLFKITKKGYVSCGIASLSAAVLNTVFFVTGLLIMFSNTEYIQGLMAALNASNFIHFALLFVGVNGLVEAIACSVIGFGLSATIIRFLPKKFRTQ